MSRGERLGHHQAQRRGKTTLVRTLLGDRPRQRRNCAGLQCPDRLLPPDARAPPADKPVYQYLQDTIKKEVPGTQMSEQTAMLTWRERSLFSGTDQDRRWDQFSGGRACRARSPPCSVRRKPAGARRPTNHLDLMSADGWKRRACDEGGYSGTMLLISHDALIDGPAITCSSSTAGGDRGLPRLVFRVARERRAAPERKRPGRVRRKARASVQRSSDRARPKKDRKPSRRTVGQRSWRK